MISTFDSPSFTAAARGLPSGDAEMAMMVSVAIDAGDNLHDRGPFRLGGDDADHGVRMEHLYASLTDRDYETTRSRSLTNCLSRAAKQPRRGMTASSSQI